MRERARGAFLAGILVSPLLALLLRFVIATALRRSGSSTLGGLLRCFSAHCVCKLGCPNALDRLSTLLRAAFEGPSSRPRRSRIPSTTRHLTANARFLCVILASILPLVLEQVHAVCPPISPFSTLVSSQPQFELFVPRRVSTREIGRAHV